jgi:hypothetical protein
MMVRFYVSDDSGFQWSVIFRQRIDGHIQITISDIRTGGEAQFDERSLLLTLYEAGAFPLSSAKPQFSDLPRP